MPSPLCRCRVLYVGSAVPTVTKDGLQGIQEPLRERYLVDESSDAKGIDSWLSVWSNGLLLDYIDGDKKSQAAFFPIQALHYCAAVRYVNVSGYSIEGGGERFLPLDSPFANLPNSKHPPIFAAILRRTSGIKVLECHAFICTNAKAANALVRCCFHAYADSMYIKMEDKDEKDKSPLKAIKEKESSRSSTPKSDVVENGYTAGADDSQSEREVLRWSEMQKTGRPNWQARQQSGDYDTASISSSLARRYRKKERAGATGRAPRAQSEIGAPSRAGTLPSVKHDDWRRRRSNSETNLLAASMPRGDPRMAMGGPPPHWMAQGVPMGMPPPGFFQPRPGMPGPMMAPRPMMMHPPQMYPHPDMPPPHPMGMPPMMPFPPDMSMGPGPMPMPPPEMMMSMMPVSEIGPPPTSGPIIVEPPGPAYSRGAPSPYGTLVKGRGGFPPGPLPLPAPVDSLYATFPRGGGQGPSRRAFEEPTYMPGNMPPPPPHLIPPDASYHPTSFPADQYDAYYDQFGTKSMQRSGTKERRERREATSTLSSRQQAAKQDAYYWDSNVYEGGIYRKTPYLNEKAFGTSIQREGFGEVENGTVRTGRPPSPPVDYDVPHQINGNRYGQLNEEMNSLHMRETEERGYRVKDVSSRAHMMY